MYETHTRSIVKSLLWRVVATLTSLVVTYEFTHSLGLATTVSLVGAAIGTALYYIHERIWDSVHWGRTKRHSK